MRSRQRSQCGPTNDLQSHASGSCTVEIWRNLVLPRTGVAGFVLTSITRIFGGPFYHLFLVARHCSRCCVGEVGRFEIYEPENHAPRQGDWRRPISFGGFLQRRAADIGQPAESGDLAWDLHRVWARNYPGASALCDALSEHKLATYRWRDHYPTWFDNMRGKCVNSNTFVEKVVEELGLENTDGSPIDLTGGGRYYHPGLGRSKGWDFHWQGDTQELHGEWQRLHRTRAIGSRRWWGGRRGVRARYVRPCRPPEAEASTHPSPESPTHATGS